MGERGIIGKQAVSSGEKMRKKSNCNFFVEGGEINKRKTSSYNVTWEKNLRKKELAISQNMAVLN